MWLSWVLTASTQILSHYDSWGYVSKSTVSSPSFIVETVSIFCFLLESYTSRLIFFAGTDELAIISYLCWCGTQMVFNFSAHLLLYSSTYSRPLRCLLQRVAFMCSLDVPEFISHGYAVVESKWKAYINLQYFWDKCLKGCIFSHILKDVNEGEKLKTKHALKWLHVSGASGPKLMQDPEKILQKKKKNIICRSWGSNTAIYAQCLSQGLWKGRQSFLLQNLQLLDHYYTTHLKREKGVCVWIFMFLCICHAQKFRNKCNIL